MCGIALLLAPDSPEAEEEMLRFQTSISDWIGPRGEPQDCSDVGVVKVSRALNNRLWLGASVLHIQGGSPASQPRRDEQGNELLWNGEVFDFETATSCHISAGISDTILVSDSLCKIVYECNETPLETLIVKVTEFMSSIRGPYAFIYFIPSRRIVLYGRDPFGRRSLVRRLLSDCSGSSHLNLVLSSVAIPGFTFEEVPIEGIYVFNIVTNETLAFKWPLSRTRLSRKHRITSSDTAHPTFESSTGSSFRFLELVRQSISKRVNSLATASQVQCATASTVGALFSGGIDSVLLARVLHDVLPPCLSIDLINVSFYDPSSHSESPDRLAAIMAWNDLKASCPHRVWNLVHVDVDAGEKIKFEDRIMNLIKPCNTYMDLNIGTAFWFASRGRGYLREYSPEEVERCLMQTSQKVPLLRIGSASSTGVELKSEENETARGITGKELHALKKKCPMDGCKMMIKHGCRFNLCSRCCRKKLIGLSLSPTEAVEAEERAETGCKAHDRKLRRYLKEGRAEPSTDRDMDESNDCADEPTILNISSSEPIASREYVSRCKVLVVGIGADEQLGGYGRHRTAFRRGKESKAESMLPSDRSDQAVDDEMTPLEMELNKDLERLWKRNLGRDDRCASDHHRELWFPFLDEEVVRFVQNLPINEIVDMTLPQGYGDKMILREAARAAGVSDRCVHLVKRAIQFGTRVAKHTNLQCHGSNRKGKGDLVFETNDDCDI